MLLSEKFISPDSPIWLIIILILAGLGLFLYGINLMSTSLKTLAGNKLKIIIEKSTNSPLKGILVGIVITVLIQSSSGTTALVVGLVSAGLMTLPQSIGVIMGANIGTTITSVLIGLPISDYFIVFAGIGAFIYFFSKKKKVKELGAAIFGFGLLFFGLAIMSSSLNVIFDKNKEFATDLFEAAVSCCNFAQGIVRILCRTFRKRVGKTHRIALFPYAAYRWKNAQVTPGTVAFYTGYSRSPAPP